MRRHPPRTPRFDSMDSVDMTLSSAVPSRARRSHTPQDDDLLSRAETGKNFKVVIRVRPPLPRELHGVTPFRNVVDVCDDEKSVSLNDAMDGPSEEGTFAQYRFTFDHVYDQSSGQKKVYDTTAKAVVDSALAGYNATIFAYGQTGTGKTYTMEGHNLEGAGAEKGDRSGSGSRSSSPAPEPESRGIIPRAIEQIFQHISKNASPRMKFLVRASYLQIYNEVISDLLKPERTNLTIREDRKRGVFVDGLSEWVVRSPREIYGLMQRGAKIRATGSTKMNELSSRSHAVFIIIAEQSEVSFLRPDGASLSPEEFAAPLAAWLPSLDELAALEADGHVRQSFKVGKLNLVDLAGSERVRTTKATGQRLEESKKINQSLSALGNVIAALTDSRGRQHIPYRNSKLTRILEDSLGGNCKTTMMAMISPALDAYSESLSTLKFANRAKNIKNEARVNEDLDQKSLLRKYQSELRRLRQELTERSAGVVDTRRLLEVEQQRKQAEMDKTAALQALEERSQEMMREKDEKRKLEHRIKMLTSQMLVGGVNGSGGKGGAPVKDTPAFRHALKEENDRIRTQYEGRLKDLEDERHAIEDEKAQVDRYKQLLLKQRDIMIALTQRLNERDEQIMGLQDELDAYDRHQRDLEERLDAKTAELIRFQRGAVDDATQQLPSTFSASSASTSAAAAVASGGEDAARAVAAAAMREAAAPTLTMDAARRRIDELAAIVVAQVQRQAGFTAELGEARRATAAVEAVLRERLHSVVDSEISARAVGGITAGAEAETKEARSSVSPAVAAVRAAELQTRVRTLTQQQLEFRRQVVEQVASKDATIATLRGEAQRAKSDLAAQLDARGAGVHAKAQQDARVLEDELRTHKKERKAITTIMESKIKVHVDNISLVLTERAKAAAHAKSARGGAASAPASEKMLTREVAALQRLVNASVAALQNSGGGGGSKEAEPSKSQSQQPQWASSMSSENRSSANSRDVHFAATKQPQQQQQQALPLKLRRSHTPSRSRSSAVPLRRSRSLGAGTKAYY